MEEKTMQQLQQSLSHQPAMKDLFPLADKLRDLRAEKGIHNDILKQINSDIQTVEMELSDAMARAECSNFTRGDKQFVLATTTRWSAVTERKEELYAVLRENGYEHLFTVNTQTLGSFVREQIEETADENGETHVPDWLLGLVKSFDDVGVMVKAAARKPK